MYHDYRQWIRVSLWWLCIYFPIVFTYFGCWEHPRTKGRTFGAWFTNELREILTYVELLKPEFYLIRRTFGWEKLFQNFIRSLYNRARCILIHNFFELGGICASKVHRKLRSPVNRSRFRPLSHCLGPARIPRSSSKTATIHSWCRQCL